MKDIWNRDLNAGDLVLDVSKLPVTSESYGLVLSDSSIYKVGKEITKKGNVYKIANPNINEVELMENLKSSYLYYQNRELEGTLIKSKYNYHIGDVIESTQIKDKATVALYIGYVYIVSDIPGLRRDGYGYIMDILPNFEFCKEHNRNFKDMMAFAYNLAGVNYRDDIQKIYMVNRYFKVFKKKLPSIKTHLHLPISIGTRYDAKMIGEVLTIVRE